MDLATKEKLKWKFYRLTVMLNLIILLVAIAIIVFFKAPEGYRIPAALVLILSTAGFMIYFWGQYRSTREWLNSQE